MKLELVKGTKPLKVDTDQLIKKAMRCLMDGTRAFCLHRRNWSIVVHKDHIEMHTCYPYSHNKVVIKFKLTLCE